MLEANELLNAISNCSNQCNVILISLQFSLITLTLFHCSVETCLLHSEVYVYLKFQWF